MKIKFDPLNDYLFYKVMGEKGDEVQLLGFLNAVLGRTGDNRFSSVEILENKSFTAKMLGDKSSILDVRAILQSNTRINVEVQLRNQHNIDKRSLFYWSREYSGSLAVGQDYSELPDVISINIVNFNFPDTRHYHSCFHLRERSENDIILTNALEIHYLNMVRFRRQGRGKLADQGQSDPLSRWLTWLDTSSPPELVTEVKQMDAAIQAADERMVYVTGDREAIRAYEMRQMALSDYTSSMNYARDKGLEEGREERDIEIARSLLAKGSSPEFVQEITGLDMDIIRGLIE